LSRDYNNAKNHYDKLFNIINEIDEKINTSQINNFTDLYIKELKYTYPNNSNIIPFTLKLIEPIICKVGEIIKLEGDYGNGKSTFCDIFNGIIPDNKYEVKLIINSKIYYSFNYICKIRYYHEQFENIDYKPSVYEIISGETEINIEDEKLVWNSIQITLCDNFITNINEESNKKYFHTKNIGLSGGQKGSIAVARTIYKIMKNQPQIVTLDEIDKAIQANVVTKIMENIYNYCKTHQILLFVICHSTEVKEMKYYDKTLKFVNGIVNCTK
jgi:ABC-type bacteriocin/lantibiotic exporter with double-glycine peptidase domain